jgi:hypothetical protein
MNREDLDYEGLLFADGFDEAIIGVEERTCVVAYDIDKIIEILMRDMTEDEAVEYFEFNILGAYVGEKTPVYIKKAPN